MLNRHITLFGLIFQGFLFMIITWSYYKLFIPDNTKHLKEICPLTVFCRPGDRILLNQLVRSVTSTGANDQEADGVSTKKDFIHCYTIVRKEMKESLYWIKLLVEINPRLKSKAETLISEADELVKIISTIIKNAKKKN